jgi:hypothetical protein
MDLFTNVIRGGQRAADTIRNRLARTLGVARGPGWAGAMLLGGIGAAVGAAGALLLDPARGRARRTRLVDQGTAVVRRGGRRAGRIVNRLRSDAGGKLTAMRHGGGRAAPTDDATLTDRVRTELFGDPSTPTDGININVERGIVVLRGEVADDAARHAIERRAETIHGVWSVRNLLSLPGEVGSTERMEARA